MGKLGIFAKNIRKQLAFYSIINFWEKLNIWSESSKKMKYIPAIKFEIIYARISYVIFSLWNVQQLSTSNFKNNLKNWDNQNSNFVQLNLITIFTTLYDILGTTESDRSDSVV